MTAPNHIRPERMLLRALLWLWAGLMLLGAVLAGITYGHPPVYLLVPGLILSSVLAWTSGRVKRWTS